MKPREALDAAADEYLAKGIEAFAEGLVRLRDVLDNGSSTTNAIAVIQFAAGSKTGTFQLLQGRSSTIAPGTLMTVTAPNIQDATAAGVDLALVYSIT